MAKDLKNCRTRNDFYGYVQNNPKTKEIRMTGSHIMVKGPKPGTAVMCGHGNETLPTGTRRSIIRMLIAIGLGILIVMIACVNLPYILK